MFYRSTPFYTDYNEDPSRGEDDLREGTGTIQLEKITIPAAPLYTHGVRTRGITAPSLYPRGLGLDPEEIYVDRDLNLALEKAHEQLQRTGFGLKAVSGFLAPANQQERWAQLMAHEVWIQREDKDSESTPTQILLAGRKADQTGSVAELIPSEHYEDELQKIMEDASLMEELGKSNPGVAPRLQAEEYLKFLANMGWIDDVKYDIGTATSVHNLGHRANLVLTDRSGAVLNMGTGVDIVSPTQRVNCYQTINLSELARLCDRDPTLVEYFESMSVRTISRALIQEIRGNRNRFMHSILSDPKLGYYLDEMGHVSIQKDNYPSRRAVYEQASRVGYKISQD